MDPNSHLLTHLTLGTGPHRWDSELPKQQLLRSLLRAHLARPRCCTANLCCFLVQGLANNSFRQKTIKCFIVFHSYILTQIRINQFLRQKIEERIEMPFLLQMFQRCDLSAMLTSGSTATPESICSRSHRLTALRLGFVTTLSTAFNASPDSAVWHACESQSKNLHFRRYFWRASEPGLYVTVLSFKLKNGWRWNLESLRTHALLCTSMHHYALL